MDRIIKRVDFPKIMQPQALKVCAYTRVSSGKDAMLHSLSAQVSHYSEMIQSHIGWVYCGVYSDEALTGTKSDREGFQQMLTDCRAGKIDMVITKSISRFARNTVTLLETVRELKNLGIDVFFEEQNIRTMSADGELMLTILAMPRKKAALSVRTRNGVLKETLKRVFLGTAGCLATECRRANTVSFRRRPSLCAAFTGNFSTAWGETALQQD